jgi:hypothetical protein
VRQGTTSETTLSQNGKMAGVGRAISAITRLDHEARPYESNASGAVHPVAGHGPGARLAGDGPRARPGR